MLKSLPLRLRRQRPPSPPERRLGRPRSGWPRRARRRAARRAARPAIDWPQREAALAAAASAAAAFAVSIIHGRQQSHAAAAAARGQVFCGTAAVTCAVAGLGIALAGGRRLGGRVAIWVAEPLPATGHVCQVSHEVELLAGAEGRVRVAEGVIVVLEELPLRRVGWAEPTAVAEEPVAR